MMSQSPAVFAKIFCGAAVCFCVAAAGASKKTKATAPESKSSQTETYKNLIEKAQNLSLQRDRLQASQILVRALAREAKTSAGFKELNRALDDLMSAFYTERAQSVFISAESNLPLKPREAIDGFTEALRLEDGNVTILKALARTHLTQGDCDKAEAFIKSAETLDPYAPEVLLLRIQALDCSKSSLLAAKLSSPDPQMASLEAWLRPIKIRSFLNSDEFKKAKALASDWESADRDYPEVYYWKWRISKEASDKDDASPQEKPDRIAAQKYVQLCQNLTPRKRKSFNLDVELCKGKESVDAFLKEPVSED